MLSPSKKSGRDKKRVQYYDHPHVFWDSLLEEQWKSGSTQTQRNRKRVQNYDDSTKKPETESAQAVKKRNKEMHNSTGPTSLKSGPKVGKVVARERRKVCDAERVQNYDDSTKKPETDCAHTVKKGKKEMHNSTDPSSLKSGLTVGKVVAGERRKVCYAQRVQNYDDSTRKPETESAQAVKKRKKEMHNSTDPTSLKSRPKVGKVVAGERRKECDAQRVQNYNDSTRKPGTESAQAVKKCKKEMHNSTNPISSKSGPKVGRVVAGERRQVCEVQRVQNYDDSTRTPETESAQAAKKHKKVMHNSIDPTSLKSGPKVGKVVAGERRKECDSQRVQNYDNPTKKPEMESAQAVKMHKKEMHNSSDPTSLNPGPKIGKVVAGERRKVCDAQRVQNYDESTRKPETESAQAVKNSKMVMHNSTDPTSLKSGPKVGKLAVGKRRKVGDTQKSLYLLLRPEILKICDILQLTEDVKGMVRKLLEYIMDNHYVSREPVTSLQAFQLSLCWIAGSLLKLKINHKESLALAKQQLNFACKKEEADIVYSKWRFLKEIFLNGNGTAEVKSYSRNPESTTKDTTKDLSHPSVSESLACNRQKESLLVEEMSPLPGCSDKQVPSPQGHASSDLRTTEKEMSTTIKQIKMICHKRMENLLRKQQYEVQALYRTFNDEKALFEKKCIVNISKDMFAKLLEEHKFQMDTRLENLKDAQLAARNKENERKVHWLAQIELTGELSLIEPVTRETNSQTSEQVRAYDDSRNASMSDHLSEVESTSKNVHSLPGFGVGPNAVSKPVCREAVQCSSLVKTATLSVKPSSKIDTMPSERKSVTECKQHNGTGTSTNDFENAISRNLPSSKEQIPDGTTLSMLGGKVPETSLIEGAKDGQSNTPNGTGIREHGVDDSIRRDTIFPVLLPLKSPMLQSVSVLAQGGPLSLYQLSQDKSKMQNTSQQVEVPVSHPVVGVSSGQSHLEAPLVKVGVVQSNHEESVLEPVVQLQPSQSTDLPPISGKRNVSDLRVPSIESNHNAPIIEPVVHTQLSLSVLEKPGPLARSEHQPSIEEHTSSQNQHNIPSDCAFASGQPYNEALTIEPDAQLQLSLSLDLPCHNQLGLPLTRGIEHQRNAGHTSSQNAQLPILLVNNVVELLDQAVSQSATHVSPTPLFDTPAGGSESHLPYRTHVPFNLEFNNRCIHTSSSAASPMPFPLYFDPLQKELEKMRKETDQTIRMYENSKMCLKYNCEKEVEEIVAQIRRKYEATLHNVEATFQHKKKELDTIHKKVYMNKMLAEALKTSGALEMQQDVPLSFPQHLVQLSLQDSALRPTSSQQITDPPRSSTFVVTPSVGQPAASQQIPIPSKPPPSSGQFCSSAASSQTTGCSPLLDTFF